MTSRIVAAFWSYSWSQKIHKWWYNFGIESPRDSSWKTSYFDRFGATRSIRIWTEHMQWQKKWATQLRVLFFSRGFFLELFQMPHNRTFGRECLESGQWSLVKTCFIPWNLLNPFQPSTPPRISLHEVSNTMRKTSYPWQPRPTWQADDEIPVRALLLAMPFLTKHSSRNLKALKKSLRFHAGRHGFCLSSWFDLMNFDFGLHFLVLTLDPTLQLPCLLK